MKNSNHRTSITQLKANTQHQHLPSFQTKNIANSSLNNANSMKPNVSIFNNEKDINELTKSKFADLTYNEQYYVDLNKNKDLPILESTGASRLIYEIHQNHNASVSSSTGQFVVSFFFFKNFLIT
jgi:hypothetical protein